MKYTFERQQRYLFQKERFLEIEAFLTQEEAQGLLSEAENICMKRLHATVENMYGQSLLKLMEAGRGLWRQSEFIHRYVAGRKFSELVAHFFEKRVLRLGVDQFLAPSEHLIPMATLPQQLLLEHLFSFQGLVGALLLCLKGGDDPCQRTVFCGRTGNVIFLAPDCPISLEELQHCKGERYLLIAYTEENGVYMHQPQDPCARVLRGWGYAIGDKLIDSLNPVIWR